MMKTSEFHCVSMDGSPGLPRPNHAFARPAVIRPISFLGLYFLLFFLATDNPKHDPEGERCSGQRRDGARGGLVEIEDDESANQCEQGNQHHGAHLNDGTSMMLDAQQRAFRFELNEYSEHHPEKPLENLGIAGIEYMAAHKPQGVQEQLPGGERHDESDHQDERCNNCLLESLV